MKNKYKTNYTHNNHFSTLLNYLEIPSNLFTSILSLLKQVYKLLIKDKGPLGSYFCYLLFLDGKFSFRCK